MQEKVFSALMFVLKIRESERGLSQVLLKANSGVNVWHSKSVWVRMPECRNNNFGGESNQVSTVQWKDKQLMFDSMNRITEIALWLFGDVFDDFDKFRMAQWISEMHPFDV